MVVVGLAADVLTECAVSVETRGMGEAVRAASAINSAVGNVDGGAEPGMREAPVYKELVEATPAVAAAGLPDMRE